MFYINWKWCHLKVSKMALVKKVSELKKFYVIANSSGPCFVTKQN